MKNVHRDNSTGVMGAFGGLADENQMQSVKYLCTTGFFLRGQQQTCTRMAEYALKSNKALCFNFSSEFLF